ncbi:MAG: DNA polymerase IV [Oscillospiraceae bacterium]|nr:DNA polymerase IV [Oscillospiraceae bacterium]
MERIILHSDINCCYAGIEMVYHPELRTRPVAVGGSEERRHGIVLAKNYLAKDCGVRTGMTLWEARRLCPELVVLPPRMELYARFAGYVQQIYADYTDRRESFGIDESWLDLTGCAPPGSGETAAREINRRVKKELGVTVSVGVSWNKIFAKLGSDYRKPDAVTDITRRNFREIVWPLSADCLLYVGRATKRRLAAVGIDTIGGIARSDPENLHATLGKMGYTLHAYANGLDASPVAHEAFRAPVKSVSNSTTTPRDLVCRDDVRGVMLALAESVGMRLRTGGLSCRLVSIGVRSSDLCWREHQKKLPQSTNLTREIFDAAMALFDEISRWPESIRSLALCCGELGEGGQPEQLDIFGESERRERLARLDAAVDDVRLRWGFDSIHRGTAQPYPEAGRFMGEETVKPLPRTIRS